MQAQGLVVEAGMGLLSSHCHPEGHAGAWTNWVDTPGKGLCPHTSSSSPLTGQGWGSLVRWDARQAGHGASCSRRSLEKPAFQHRGPWGPVRNWVQA